VIDIPEQDWHHPRHVQVGSTGALLEGDRPERASYGITNLPFAIIQLAQRPCEARSASSTSTAPRGAHSINHQVVTEIDKARSVGRQSAAHEIKKHPPPGHHRGDGEAMRAEREKRAAISKRRRADALINTARA